MFRIPTTNMLYMYMMYADNDGDHVPYLIDL